MECYFSPLGESLSFACPKESDQRKRHPLPLVSCASRQSGRLRNSRFQHSNSPRRRLPLCLRCSARQQGIESQNHTDTVIASLRFYFRRGNLVFWIASLSHSSLKPAQLFKSSQVSVKGIPNLAQATKTVKVFPTKYMC